jgi:hypothetical protein
MKEGARVHPTALSSFAIVTQDAAKEIVETALATINTHRWRDAWVPHGFVVRAIRAEECPDPFAPGVLSDYLVTATLSVPMIYTAVYSHGSLRASLPIDLKNVNVLRDWLLAEVQGAPVRRADVSAWDMAPKSPSAPYSHTGEPNGAPGKWLITVVIRIA